MTPPDSSDEALHWTKVAEVAATYEGDMARQLLEAHGIPVVVLSDRIGVFGPGFVGPSAFGVSILVPSDRADQARRVLTDFEIDTVDDPKEGPPVH